MLVFRSGTSSKLTCHIPSQGIFEDDFPFPVWYWDFPVFLGKDISSLWSNYSDLTRPGPPNGGLVGEMGPLISRKSRLVKYFNLCRRYVNFLLITIHHRTPTDFNQFCQGPSAHPTSHQPPLPRKGHRFGGGRSPCALHEHAGGTNLRGKTMVGFGIPRRWGPVTTYKWSYGAPINGLTNG